MTYYDKLVAEVQRAMEAHPDSTVAIDAETFAVLATGRSPAAVASRIEKVTKAGCTPVVFSRPKKGETWIL